MTAKPAERFMPEDESSGQFKVWEIIESNTWEITIMSLISLNTLLLMVEVSTHI